MNIKKLMIVWVLILSLVGIQKVEASYLSDVSGHWSEPYVEKFYELGYIQGYDDGTFRPYDPITRAEFVKLVNKAFELTGEVKSLPFIDINREWQVKELKVALANKYITPALEFRPNASINRQEVAKIVGQLLEDEEGTIDSSFRFNDEKDIATWAIDYVKKLVNQGILSRNETFRPKDSITRAEASKILFLSTQPSVKAESIELGQTSVKLKVGEMVKVKSVVKPANTTNKQLNWRTDNANIAVVDRNGNIQGVGVGETTIRVSADSNASVSRTIKVKVEEVIAESVTVSPTKVDLKIGESTKVTVSVSPSNTTNKGIKWSSSNSSVATVDSNGNVKAIAEGTATITATSTSNSSLKASLTITVNAPKKLTFTGYSFVNTVGNFDGWWIDYGAAFWGPYGTWNEHNISVTPWAGRYSPIPTLDVYISVFGHNVHPEETSQALNKALSRIIPSGASTIASKVKANAKGNETYEFDGRKVVVSYSGITEIEIHGKK